MGDIGQGYLGKGCVYTRSTLLHMRLRSLLHSQDYRGKGMSTPGPHLYI
jgi:hypothetical protein